MELFFKYDHIGNKKIQEDLLIKFKLDNYDFYFVFDGHGYKNKNDSLIDYLLINNFFSNFISDYFKKNIVDVKNIKYCFLELDKIICKNIPSSGSCVTGLIFSKKDNKIFLINLGDTMFLGISEKKKIVIKSSIHDLNNEKELKRIKLYGKEDLIKNGRYKKVVITRSLGDNDCKELYNEPLISIPEVLELECNKFFYFILSTDGIKMNFNIQKIIDIIDDSNNLKNYFEYVMKNNLESNKKIDNICFIILKTKFKQKKNKINFLDLLIYKNLFQMN